MASELKVNKISPESGTTLTLGDSGDTINFGSGVLPNFENLTVTGDLTVDTNSLKVDSTNNFVGIGTATPAVALDVVGAITATGNITGTLATAAQPNITSVGTLSSLSVSGNITGTLATAAQPNITSLGTLTGLTTTGNINLGDSDKINFGASNDLQIYHDGSDQNSYIKESGSGFFYIDATNFRARNTAGTEMFIRADENDAVKLYYDNSEKLATTSTGIDVTGTITSDGLTMDTSADTTYTLEFGANRTVDSQALGIIRGSWNGTVVSQINLSAGDDTTNKDNGQIFFRTAEAGTTANRLQIAENGDISFYEDTGTTPKFFWDASAENLGIGTSSPTDKLHVSSAVAAGVSLQATDTGGSTWRILSTDNLASISGGKLAFNNGSYRMVIDGSGNVGIGTSSPSSWGGTFKAIDINSYASFSADSDTAFMTANGYYNGTNWIYKNTNGATRYFQQAGNHIWSKASSGTAGNTITWSEAMRIDSSGRVGIGNTTPNLFNAQARNLVVGTGSGANGITIYSGNTSTADIFFSDGTTGDDPTRGGINYNHSNNSMNFRVNDSPKMYILSNGNVGIGTSSPDKLLHLSAGTSATLRFESTTTGATTGDIFGAIEFETQDANSPGVKAKIDAYSEGGVGNASLRFFTGDTVSLDEAMRIDSSGNVGIGTSTTSGAKLSIQPSSAFLKVKEGRVDATNNVRLEAGGTVNTYLEYRGYLGHIWDVDSTERMRIDSSGNLLINTSSTFGGIINIKTSSSRITGITSRPATNITYNFTDFQNSSGTNVGGIGVTASSTTYSTSSDYRLKENIVEMTGATERLKQLQPKRFNFIADANTIVDGFLAHEVSDIVPEAITGTKDEVDEEGNPIYQGIDQSKLVPLLVATIKELEARITALENA